MQCHAFQLVQCHDKLLMCSLSSFLVLGKRSPSSAPSNNEQSNNERTSPKKPKENSKRQKWELCNGQDYTFTATKNTMLDIRGKVYKGILSREKADVAVKEIAIKKNDSQKIWDTIAPICKLRNEFILRLHGASVSPDRVHLVAELMEIDLHNALHNPACQQRHLYLWTGPNGKRVLRGIAKGLKYLHSRGIVHSNIKSQNIFLKGKIVKIGDIGSTQLNIRLCFKTRGY